MVKGTILFTSIFFLLTSLACVTPLDKEAIDDQNNITAGKYNLNTVTYEELITLDGIKKNVAREIIKFRQVVEFKRIEDLLAVKGIGEKTFYLVKDYFFVK